MRLLSVSSDAKTVKGEKKGFLTGILYLAPADEASTKKLHINVCTSSTVDCRRACLYSAGRASIFPAIKRARIRKTRLLYKNRELFLELLRKDIRALIARAKRQGLTPCVRINGTSDLPWLSLLMAGEFPEIQFYDYSAHIRTWERIRPNYHLTFSYKGSNLEESLLALQNGINVSVVFQIKKGHPLPETWQGYPVIDGDLSDLRFTDPKGCIVGLRSKGEARKQVSSFVQISAPLPRVA
jgi:hypothetical protein